MQMSEGLLSDGGLRTSRPSMSCSDGGEEKVARSSRRPVYIVAPYCIDIHSATVCYLSRPARVF